MGVSRQTITPSHAPGRMVSTGKKQLLRLRQILPNVRCIKSPLGKTQYWRLLGQQEVAPVSRVFDVLVPCAVAVANFVLAGSKDL